MRIHHYEGDGFCVVPLDGVPCLGQRYDRSRHVQQYKGPPKRTNQNIDDQTHILRVATMNKVPIRYYVLLDYNAYRRMVIGQHTTLERCQLDLDDKRNQELGQMWIEDISDPINGGS